MTLVLAGLSGYERVQAVHKTFADKTTEEIGDVLFWMLACLTAALIVLAIIHRIQLAMQRREEARRRRARRPPAAPPKDATPEFGSPRPTISGYASAPTPSHPAVRS